MKIVHLYYLKTCKACKPYSINLKQCCDRLGFTLEMHLIEDNPMAIMAELLRARHSGAFIKHAPFITIHNDDKYKAVGGILNEAQIYNILKDYE